MTNHYKILFLLILTLSLILIGLNTVSASNDTYIIGQLEDTYTINFDKDTQVKFDENDINNVKNGKTASKVLDTKGTFTKYEKSYKNTKKKTSKYISVGKIKNKKFPNKMKHPVTGKVYVHYFNQGLKKDLKLIKKIDKKTYKKFKKTYNKYHKKGWKYHHTEIQGNSKGTNYKIKIKLKGFKKVKKTVYVPKTYNTGFKAVLTKGDNVYPFFIYATPVDVNGGSAYTPAKSWYYIDGVLESYCPGGMI